MVEHRRRIFVQSNLRCVERARIKNVFLDCESAHRMASEASLSYRHHKGESIASGASILTSSGGVADMLSSLTSNDQCQRTRILHILA